ncbi:MAG: hypothetical protein SynsKO_32620 [Synoicihabitans sp.]
MKRYPGLLAFLFIVAGLGAEVPSAMRQIELAVLAAPEAEREACTVLGYDTEGVLVTLRQGTNGLTCLADDPKKKGFSAACYSSSLEGYMQRGRDLRAEGKGFQEVFDIREEEVKSGKLTIPTNSILNVLTGDFNAESGELENTYQRYVIYIPFATPESTGIPLGPATPGGPWIMNPGTHRAHIMINPPKPKPAEHKHDH